jgi:hypothetical protein
MDGYTTTVSRKVVTTYNSPETASNLATLMYQVSIEKLKSMFSGSGMTLLTPDEFLTDDAKKTTLVNFMPEGGIFNKVFKQDESIKSRGAAQGFLTKPVNSIRQTGP